MSVFKVKSLIVLSILVLSMLSISSYLNVNQSTNKFPNDHSNRLTH
jgi:hypothetical protein